MADATFPSLEENDNFFEGPEKTLEVWFDGNLPEERDVRAGCRLIPRKDICSMLKSIGCDILSDMHNEYVDSYVLSESSLFITNQRVMIKTCGTIALLTALPVIMKLADAVGLNLQDVFFNRCSYGRPEQQPYPHKNWKQEVGYLDEQFPDGSAYLLGRVNKAPYYLYTLNAGENIDIPDESMELMMTELDPVAMQNFYKSDVIQTTEDCLRISKIDQFFPEAQLDGHLFEPCGFSVNGLYKTSYFTIHVTPQPECSYVSFETDMSLETYSGMIEKVVEIFKPKKFTVGIYSNQPSAWSTGFKCGKPPSGFRRVDNQICQLGNHAVEYGHFVREEIST